MGFLMVRSELLAKLRPNDRAGMLRKAFGESREEPNCHAEGHVCDDDVSARITIDDKIGEITFRQSFPIDIKIGGVRLGSPASSFDALYSNAIEVPDERNDYGWSFKQAIIEAGADKGLQITVGIKDNQIRITTLSETNAIYQERPYKYADPMLTDALI